jgi:hypothetical protein
MTQCFARKKEFSFRPNAVIKFRMAYSFNMARLFPWSVVLWFDFSWFFVWSNQLSTRTCRFPKTLISLLPIFRHCTRDWVLKTEVKTPDLNDCKYLNVRSKCIWFLISDFQKTFNADGLCSIYLGFRTIFSSKGLNFALIPYINP